MEELEQLVVQNNTEAIYELGNEYFIGKQVQKDYYKAISLFKKAENLGNTKGKYGLAKCYYYGRGVEKDYEKAYNMFYELMTKNKDIEAKYYVGLMYYWGDFVKRDYKKAFNIFKDLYEKANDKYALMMLPGMYYYGQGTEVDFEKTRQLGEIALENSDDKYISYYLGEIYYYGKGINKNYKKAKTYFEKSIDDTDDGAYYYLGLIYQEGGDGINKDEEKSKRYFHKVEHDFCTAITYYILAVYDEKENQLNDWMEMLSYDRNTLSKIINLLPKGHPCIRDYKKLNSLKDEQYNRIANIVKEKIQSYYSKKTIITIQVAENEEEVNILSDVMILSYEYESIQSYFEDMCKRDDKKILYLVGKMYYYGAGCEKNTNLGLKYLKRSASQGYAYAQYELAVISYDCNNFVETEHYLSNILEGEDTYLASLANNLVGQMYYFGHGVEKNFEKAYNYYRNSAEKNYSHAQLALGLAYLWGEGTTQDIDKAIYWLEESAKRNNSNAQCALGYLYYYGQDEGFNIPINKEYAIELLTKAANNGNKKAQTELEKIKNQTHYNKTRDNN